MKFTLNSTIRWLYSCLIFFAASCKDEQSGYKDYVPTTKDSIDKKAMIQRALADISNTEKLIRTGDLVTRTGNDFTSQSLKTLNQRNKTYSHCGIASIEHDSVFIYHALGGEWNPDEKIRRDPFALFAEPYSNNGIGIFRFSVNDPLKDSIQKTIQYFFRKGIMFDMDFDLHTDDRMYCAEFVYKSYTKATDSTLVFPTSHINTFEFIGVDDIFLHPLCKPVKEIIYK